MKALKMPISFTNGRISTLSNLESIVKQKIIDVLVTANRERVMNPTYGAGAYTMLYEPLDPLVFADFKQEALSDINKNVSNAIILDLLVSPEESIYSENYSTTLKVTVVYQVPPHQQSVMTFTVSEYSSESSFL
jgi:hypothetical protein